MDDGPRRSHTGRRRNEAAQEAILDATFRLLSHPGEAVTIDAIAAEAGVGRQTIYRWWPSKGAVVADALARHAQVVVPERDTGSFAKDLAFRFGEPAGVAFPQRVRRLGRRSRRTCAGQQIGVHRIASWCIFRRRIARHNGSRRL